ncbi:hypothetical protein HK096_002728 [Nowakowskiella sp. JEL0078]|nr:hypothetical protein HK096_002728 [Nowakowskiella sp. JEL0078]
MDFADPERVWRSVEEEKNWSLRESFVKFNKPDSPSESEFDVAFEDDVPTPPVEILPPPPPPPSTDYFNSPPLSPLSSASSAAATTWKSFTSFTNIVSSEIGAFIKIPTEKSSLADVKQNREIDISESDNTPFRDRNMEEDEKESDYEEVKEENVTNQFVIKETSEDVRLPNDFQDIAQWGETKPDKNPKKEEPIVVPGLEDAVAAFNHTFAPPTLNAWDEEEDERSEQTETLNRYADYLQDLGVPSSQKLQVVKPAKASSSQAIQKSTSKQPISSTMQQNQSRQIQQNHSAQGPNLEFSTDSTITFYQGFRAAHPSLAIKRTQQQQITLQQQSTRSTSSPFQSLTSSLNPAARLLRFYSQGGMIDNGAIVRSAAGVGLRHYNSKSSFDNDSERPTIENGHVAVKDDARLLRALPDTARTQAGK